MFVDFNSVFNNEKNSQFIIPKPLVDYMNKSLPIGMKYVIDEDGDCRITSDSGQPITIGGFIFSPTKKQLAVLGENYTQEDVINYFYNIQEPIPLSFSKNGYIKLNGQDFEIERIKYNPLHPIKYVMNSFCMYPNKFPDPFKVRIGCEECDREVEIKRVINESVNICRLQTNDDEPLQITIYLDEKNHTMKLNISFDLSKAMTVRDIVQVTSIYNAYLAGKGTMFNKPLEGQLEGNDLKCYDENSLTFWKKVLQLEDKLQVTFEPPMDDIQYDTILQVEELYQCLIKGNPYIDTNIVNSIDGNWDMKENKEISDKIGAAIYFEFEATNEVELFDKKIILSALVAIFGAKLVECVTENGKQKLILEDADENNKRFTSIMLFSDEKELKTFRAKDHNEILDLMHSAKRISEYI